MEPSVEIERPRGRSHRARVMDLVHRITDPSPLTLTLRDRWRARFIIGLGIIATPIFVIVQNTSFIEASRYPSFYFIALMLLVAMVLTKTNHLRAAKLLILAPLVAFPYVTLLINNGWNELYVMSHILWIMLTVLVGNYLLDIKAEMTLLFSTTLAFLVTLTYHPNVEAERLQTAIYLMLGTLLLITVGYAARQYFIERLMQREKDLLAQQRETELYVSIVAHDLGNDLQTAIQGVELASLELSRSGDSGLKNLKASNAAIDRMGELLKIFSVDRSLRKVDFMTLIESVSKRAVEVHESLKVSITCTTQADTTVRAGRLLPMVFENLLRNAAQHAGPNPRVTIRVNANDENVQVVVADDGQGISPDVRPVLFQRGASTAGEGRGQGLYLVKRILESYGGSIQLVDDSEHSGCAFQIVMPKRP
ncbi:MAG: sensor histidine kinase [Candidatus Thorarchaeota archaeon]